MLVVFALFVVSLGIYYFVWYYRVNGELRDLGRAADDVELARVRPGIALLAVTVGSVVLVPAVVSVARTFGRIRRAEALLAVRDQLDAIERKLVTPPVRYSKPELQAHIQYLYGMTTQADQKVGRDAVERYEVLRKELDAVLAELRPLLGPAAATDANRR
jgi:HAMP domain-containing protein